MLLVKVPTSKIKILIILFKGPHLKGLISDT